MHQIFLSGHALFERRVRAAPLIVRAIDSAQPGQLRLYRELPDPAHWRREIVQGLSGREKFIDSKFFYDATGSALFERITRLPEYYPTRAEHEILRRFRPGIAAQPGPGAVLLEPGCGSGEKTALLLEALKPSAYVGWDISESALHRAGATLTERFPRLPCHLIAADYGAALPLPDVLPAGRRCVFFPGSSIGNLEPRAAVLLLQRFAQLVGPGGGLLIGVSQPRPPERALPAYNDRQGLTAAFNKNCLRHVNTLTGSRFSSEAFDHCAVFNAGEQRIELSLRCRYAHRVRVGDSDIAFGAGEHIRTEYVYPYSTRAFSELAARACFRRRKSWYDAGRLFGVFYFTAESEPVEYDTDPALREYQAARPRRELDEGPYDIPDRRRH